MLSPEEMLALIAERAADLRKAGVRKLQTAELTLELDAYEPPPERARDMQHVEIVDESDPLSDPSTFAMRDGSIPGFKSRRKPDSE